MHPDNRLALNPIRSHLCPDPLEYPLPSIQPRTRLHIPWRNQPDPDLIKPQKDMIKDYAQLS